MNRRTLLRLSLAPLLFGSVQALAQPGFQPTPQDKADLGRIETYLDGLRTLKARFLQVAPNGALSQGTAWLERPGRMRFQYDPPSPFLLVAGHGLVVFHDRSLNQTSNIPIGRTPLGHSAGGSCPAAGRRDRDRHAASARPDPGHLVRTASPATGR